MQLPVIPFTDLAAALVALVCHYPHHGNEIHPQNSRKIILHLLYHNVCRLQLQTYRGTTAQSDGSLQCQSGHPLSSCVLPWKHAAEKGMKGSTPRGRNSNGWRRALAATLSLIFCHVNEINLFRPLSWQTKAVPVHVTNAHGWDESTAPLILNLNTKWK
jgi:hypothetical protein